MPFSSLSDPSTLERAQAALDAAWAEVVDSISEEDWERERVHLSYAIVSAMREATEQAEVVRIGLENFHNKRA